MANGLMKLVLSLTGRDDGARRLLADTERQLKRTALSKQQAARANRPYEVAGIRSEKNIRREIRATEAAYNRLRRSGIASQNDLSRAARATKQRIAELNAELGRSSKLQKATHLGGAALAAGTAAYAVLKPAMDDKKQLNANINQVARQAFIEDENKSAQWIATQGAAEIKKLALSLIESNGGNADSALGMISAMMTNGMSFKEVKADAKTSYAAMMAASENGQYNPDDTAKLMKVLKDAGFNGKDLGLAFEKALQSGLDGNFEITDMVRELPALLPQAQQAGLNGMQGLEYLLSLLQSAANKTGSTSEAATNVSNILNKALAADTVKRLSKLANPASPGKGIDWEGSVLRGKENGENAVQVLSRLVDAMLAKDNEYQNYKAKSEKGDNTAKEQMNMMRGFVLSQVMPDLQAKQGLLAAADLEQISSYMKSLAGVTHENGKVNRLNEARMLTDAAKQEKNNAMALLQEDITEPLINFQTKLTGLSAEFPNATLATKTLAASAMAAAGALGALALVNGKGLGDLIPGGKGGVPKGGVGGGLLGKIGSKLLNAKTGLGLGLLFHADSLNTGEDERMAAMREAYRTGKPYLPAQPRPRLRAEPLAPLRPLEPLKPAEPLAPIITQQTAAYQTAIAEQTAAYHNALAADTEAVTAGLNNINSTLGGLNQTIQNNMTVTLDGRIIANEVSRHQVAMFGRGAGQ
ncbi:PRTRC system protein F [Neisseria sp. S1]|uniref:PRTRC system protein F n=1 Tax=Neisseria sp. S1 TaxID=3318354 RepID=UPI003A86345E